VSPEGSSATVAVHVQPRSSRNSVDLQPDGSLKIRLTAAPVDGSANSALIELLADRLRLPRQAFRILTGRTGRHKLVRINGIDLAALRAKLSDSSCA
jgi:uncharacterized protein (TIGR00251 family)